MGAGAVFPACLPRPSQARPHPGPAGRQACAELQQEVPTDSQVLNLLAVVWKAAGQPGVLTAAYEAACAARPRNTDLLHGLFAAHIACGPRSSRPCPQASAPGSPRLALAAAEDYEVAGRAGSLTTRSSSRSRCGCTAPGARTRSAACGGSSPASSCRHAPRGAPETAQASSRSAVSLAHQGRGTLRRDCHADRGAGDSARSLSSDKLLQLAGSLAAKQLARAPDECCREELLLHVHILQARAAPAPPRRWPLRCACARPRGGRASTPAAARAEAGCGPTPGGRAGARGARGGAGGAGRPAGRGRLAGRRAGAPARRAQRAPRSCAAARCESPGSNGAALPWLRARARSSSRGERGLWARRAGGGGRHARRSRGLARDLPAGPERLGCLAGTPALCAGHVRATPGRARRRGSRRAHCGRRAGARRAGSRAGARPWRTPPSRKARRRVCERVRMSASPARMDRALHASAQARRYRL